ncbi:HNH endonuclease [Ilumatobacter fluminis]|nr:HNH endonuclease [Ilumatobacter fluminis]
MQEMVSLQLARRLISAGTVLLGRHGPVAAEAEIKQAIIDTMLIHWDSAGDVFERLMPAVRSATEPLRDSVRRTVEAYSRREAPNCYLCGVEVDFGGADHLQFTIDHVWPRAYGGNSDFENLLAACKGCNEAKGSAASWAMYPVQALVVGHDLDDLSALPKVMRFAVQARAAKQVARSRDLSLRDAYLAIGRPGQPLVLSASTAVDVFNLEFTAAKE